MDLNQLVALVNNKNIAFANINDRAHLINDYLKDLNIKINIIGGWNYHDTPSKKDDKDKPLHIYSTPEDFFKVTPKIMHPNIIFILPNQEAKIVFEIQRILAADSNTLKAIVVLLSTRVNPSEALTNQIKDICFASNIEVVFINVVHLGYSLAYLLEEPDNMPWVFKQLDKDLEESLEKYNINKGSFLDLGTGTGHQAVELAKMGFEVTATDLVPSAFEKIKNSNVDVEFIQDDITNSKLQKKYNYIFDRGCFHSYDVDKTKYLSQVVKLLNPGGILFLKCFGKESEADYGPETFTKEDICNFFSEYFIIKEVKSTVYERDNVQNLIAKALFAVMIRK